MRPVLLVAATRLELGAAFGAAGAEADFEAGRLVPWRDGFLLTVTGIGVLNSAFVMGRVLAAHSFRAVVNLGIAGSFDRETLPVGATCVVRREIWPECGLATADGVQAEGLGFPLGDLDGRPVWDRVELAPEKAAEAAGARLPEAWHRVDGLTVSAVTGTAERALMLRRRYGAPGLPMIESMEGFALAYACAREDVPLLEIRTVSNPVGSRAREDWDVRAGLRALEDAVSLMFGEGG